jgi:hypothetical protein
MLELSVGACPDLTTSILCHAVRRSQSCRGEFGTDHHSPKKQTADAHHCNRSLLDPEQYLKSVLKINEFYGLCVYLVPHAPGRLGGPFVGSRITRVRYTASLVDRAADRTSGRLETSLRSHRSGNCSTS